MILTGICFPQEGSFPDNGSYKKRTYKVFVFRGNTLLAQSYLLNITDSTVVLSARPLPFRSLNTGKVSTREFGYPEIESIILKKKGGAGSGAIAGLFIGGGLGALAGLASGDDETGWFRLSAGDKAAALGLGGGIVGALIGAFLGALSHQKFMIGHKTEKLQEMNATLLEKLYTKKP